MNPECTARRQVFIGSFPEFMQVISAEWKIKPTGKLKTRKLFI